MRGGVRGGAGATRVYREFKQKTVTLFVIITPLIQVLCVSVLYKRWTNKNPSPPPAKYGTASKYCIIKLKYGTVSE
jgi:hypothetical protein